MKSMPSLLPIFAVLSVLSATAYADNIVVDGNFEGADPGVLTSTTDGFDSGSSIDGGSWFVTQGTVAVDTLDQYVFDGNKSVFLDGDGGPDSLSQTLPTVPGDNYNVSFWANADVPNNFAVTFGGDPVSGAPTSIAQNGFPSDMFLGNSSLFTFYSGTATATSSSSDLTFSSTAFQNDFSGATVELDDVAVSTISPTSAVPEPSTLALAAVLALMIPLAAFWRRRNFGA